MYYQDKEIFAKNTKSVNDILEIAKKEIANGNAKFHYDEIGDAAEDIMIEVKKGGYLITLFYYANECFDNGSHIQAITVDIGKRHYGLILDSQSELLWQVEDEIEFRAER